MKFVVLGTGFPDIIQTIEDIKMLDTDLDFLGFLDDNTSSNSKNLFGYDYLGSISWLEGKSDTQAFNTIARDLSIKAKINKNLSLKGIKFINLIHPSINTSYSEIGNEGILISKNAYLEAKSKISSHSIILQGSSIGHDCYIGENTFIGPGCNILGGVKIGRNCLIGAGTTIYPGITVGDDCITGINSIILKDIEDSETFSSNPSRKIRG
tara:strand:- start:196 stop:825 length:630 start_codon:yes stop_codon:yes gene_type:complete